MDGSPLPQVYQCWDFCSEFWYNIGFGTGYPHTGPNHSAYECWTESKTANAGNKFTLIYDKTQIKQGDVIVYNYFTGNPYGHIGFADEDYNGTDNMQLLSQNNDATKVTVHNYSLSHFLGAFRYNAWHEPTPTPGGRAGRSNFKWVLYARKLRSKR